MKSSVNKPTNRVGKVKLSIIMALVVILPIGALMVAVIRNGGVSVESQVVLTQEQQVERAEQLQAIDSYNRATLGMQAMLATQRVEQEQWLDTLIQQSQLVEQAMQELDRVYSNASYISEEAKYFIEALQAQIQALGIDTQASQGNSTTRLDSNNWWIKVWFVNVGYHFSPALCADMVSWLDIIVGFGEIAGIALKAKIMAITGLSAATLTSIAIGAAIFVLHFKTGAITKGVNLYFVPFTMHPVLF